MSAADRFGRVRESDGLARSLMMLRNRWLIVVAVVLACVLVAVVHHERGAKTYSATASVAFQSGTLSDAALQVSPGGTAEPQREADTEVLIAHSPEVALGVRRQLRTPVSSSELLNEVKVEAAPNANVLNVVAATGDPRYSARLANAFAEQYIAFRTRSELAGIESAQGKLNQQIACACPRVGRTGDPAAVACSASPSCGRSPAAARTSSGWPRPSASPPVRA